MNVIQAGAAILVLAVAGCASTSINEPPPLPPGAAALDDAQARDALVGKTFSGTSRKGHPYTISFRANGTDVFTMPPAAPETEHWTMTNGLLCIDMKSLPKECSRVNVMNNQYWLVDPSSGKVNNHLKLIGDGS